MSSPILWGPNNLATNLENGIIQSNGTLNSQQGPVNYLSYGNIANGLTTGWSLGTTGTLTNAIPTGTPTFGSGTSALTLSAVASGQSLSGYALSLAASSATTVGNMLASQAYTIATEDQAKVLTFKCYYSTTSGVANVNFSGTSSNSFGIAFWDATNSVWLSSTANFGMTQSTGVGYVTCTLQTGITTASIQVVIYAANATGGAATLQFTDLFLGPQTAPLGAVVTDLKAATTLTFNGLGTVTNNLVMGRVGDRLIIQGQFTTGTVAASTASITIPYSIDFTKAGSSSVGTLLGTGVIGGTGTAGVYTSAVGFAVFSDGSSANTLFLTYQTGASGFVKANGSAVFNNTAVNSFYASVPIAGWSSNVQTSNDSDTRVVAARTTGATATVNGSYSDVTWTTVASDTHGAMGAINYTIPVTGYYDFTGGLYASATTIAAGNIFSIALFNTTGSAIILESDIAYEGTNNTSQSVSFAFSSVLLSAGTQVKVQVKSSTTSPVITSSATYNHFEIARRSGPSVIAATESVNATYGLTNAVTPAGNAVIKYDTKVKDTHNAFSISTGLYTIPVSGSYQISIGSTAAGIANIFFSQNGTGKAYLNSLSASGVGSGGTIIWPFNAGDTVSINTDTSRVFSATGAGGYQNFFSISRVGN